MKKLAAFLTSNAGIATLCLLLLNGVLATSLGELRIDASSDTLLVEDDPDLRAYRDDVQNYPSSSFLVVIWDFGESIFAEEHVAAIRELVDDLEQVEGITGVNSLLDIPLFASPKQSLADALSDPRTLETPGVDLDQAEAELTTSPIFSELLVSSDGTVTGIQATLTEGGYGSLFSERYALLDKIEAGTATAADHAELADVRARIRAIDVEGVAFRDRLVDEVRTVLAKHEGVGSLYLGGVPMIAKDMIDFVRSDLSTFGGLVILVFLLVLALLLRDPLWVITPIVMAGVLAVGVLGVAATFDWPLTVVSSNSFPLLLILTISIALHLIVRYREVCGREGVGNSSEACTTTLNEMLVPCAAAGTTTAVGFLSLTSSGIKPVDDFGLLMAVSITFAFFASFILLPLVFRHPRVFDRTRRRASGGGSGDVFIRGMPALMKNPLKTLLLCFAFTIGMGVGTIWLSVDNRFIDYFDTETEIYQGMELFDTALGGTIPLDIYITAPEEAEAELETEDMFDDMFGEFSEESDDSGGYYLTNRGIDEVERLNKAMQEFSGVGKILSVAEARILVEQVFDRKISDLELALVVDALPEDIRTALVSGFLNDSATETRLSMRLVDSDAELKRSELINAISAEIEAQGLGDRARVSGVGLLYNNVLLSLFESQVRTLAVVALAIWLILLVVLRQPILALFALLPSMATVIAVLGGMGWVGIRLDIMVITVAAVSVGLAVDNAVHIVMRIRQELAHGAKLSDASYTAIATSGRAISMTAITVVCGFLVLTASHFVPSQYFGSLMAIAITFAMAASVYLLPLMLSLAPRVISKN